MKKFKTLLAQQVEMINNYKQLGQNEQKQFYGQSYLPVSQQSHSLLEETQSYLVQRAKEQQQAYQKDVQFGYWLLGEYVYLLFC